MLLRVGDVEIAKFRLRSKTVIYRSIIALAIKK